MANANKLKEAIKMIASDVQNGSVPGGYTRAKLINISPLEFELTSKLKLYGQFLVTPRFKVFRPEDIGKEYVFFKDHGGQTYYYAYEPVNPQGSNGEPYFFEGDIECEIHGSCSHGPVVVTSGKIFKIEHRKQVGK